MYAFVSAGFNGNQVAAVLLFSLATGVIFGEGSRFPKPFMTNKGRPARSADTLLLSNTRPGFD